MNFIVHDLHTLQDFADKETIDCKAPGIIIIDTPHAVPIAYALAGYSLKTESIQHLLKEVRYHCHKKGLHIPIK